MQGNKQADTPKPTNILWEVGRRGGGGGRFRLKEGLTVLRRL